MRRWLWIALFNVFPFARRRLWRPHGEGPDEFRYACWSCNQWSSDRTGYSGYLTREYQELCERCWRRRRRWSWLYWLETGERVEVPEVDGDGVVSPSTSRGSRTYTVHRLFGFEFVSATAARRGRENSRNAGYWFRRLGVHGNGEMVGRIRTWLGRTPSS